MPVRTSTYAVLSATFAFAYVLATPAMASQNHSQHIPEIDWDTSLVSFQFDNDKFIGQRLTAKCMPADARHLDQIIHGTDTYPSKSSICLAGLHAGLIDKNGGVVTVQLNPGNNGYTGSHRNGVETASLPATPRSMVFVASGKADVANQVRQNHVPRVDWDTKFTSTGLANRRLIGQRFVFNCPAAPADLRPRRVVGTDAYAFHSMICRAAVHAGHITTGGGTVTVQMDPGDKRLSGSIRNGIDSKDGPSGIRTISFVSAAVKN